MRPDQEELFRRAISLARRIDFLLLREFQSVWSLPDLRAVRGTCRLQQSDAFRLIVAPSAPSFLRVSTKARIAACVMAETFQAAKNLSRWIMPQTVGSFFPVSLLSLCLRLLNPRAS